MRMAGLRYLLLLGMLAAAQVHAGLFVDEDMKKNVDQNTARIAQLESRIHQLEETAKQQTKAMLDLQGQIESLNQDLRKLRGQNEEISHGLDDAEKRQKDFYVDLDTRVRQLEAFEAQVKSAPPPPTPQPQPAASTDANDPGAEDRAFEDAYSLYKSGKQANSINAFQDFLKKYPDSVHVPNANLWLGNAQLELKNYKSAMLTYQGLLKDYPDTPRTPEVMLSIAKCQRGLKQSLAAKKTLKQIIAKYPGSDAAAKAKKLLAAK